MILSKQDYKYYLQKDHDSSEIPPFNTFISKVQDFFFPNYEWKYIKALRWLEYCENVRKKNALGKIQWIIAKYKFRKISVKLGLSIPINVLGSGISLPHRGNIVINPQTKIGCNCRIHVGVNIGAHKNKAPIIGNNVYIGPGAIIFGDVKIADNVSIGANATVTKSVLEPNTVVAGTPARIIKADVESWNGVRPQIIQENE